MDITSYFEYDETSPSCLRWAIGATSQGRGSAERKAGDVAGSYHGNIWHIHITESNGRIRTTAPRIIWTLHNGQIPDKHYILSVNGDTSDIRIDNLMCVSHNTLQYIKKWREGTAYVGETKYGKFYSLITIDGVKKYLGTYPTYEEAATVYRTALKQQLLNKGITL